MKAFQITRIVVSAACVAALGMSAIASAQSVHHDKMDSRAAKRDIARLQKDRARAVRYKNWSKVAQDDRLISQDRFWVHRDSHKIEHGGG